MRSREVVMRVSLILFFGLLCVTLLAGSSASGAEIVVTPGPGAIAAAIAKSVEGEEDMVDVTMRDAADVQGATASAPSKE